MERKAFNESSLEGRVRIAIVGDPHGSLDKIRKVPLDGVDLILCTGDLGKADMARNRYFENIERKKKGLSELKEDKEYARDVYMEIHNSTVEVLKYMSQFAPVYTIQGNVMVPTMADARKRNNKWGLKLPATTKEIAKLDNVHLVNNRLRIINGKRIGFLEYFTDINWVQDFKPSNYAKRMKKARAQTQKARKVLKRFGKDLDILVFHQPPYGYLDTVGAPAPMHWRGKNAGSKSVLEYIKTAQPSYAFCGHIHEGEGETTIGKTKVYNLGVGGYKIITL